MGGVLPSLPGPKCLPIRVTLPPNPFNKNALASMSRVLMTVEEDNQGLVFKVTGKGTQSLFRGPAAESSRSSCRLRPTLGGHLSPDLETASGFLSKNSSGWVLGLQADHKYPRTPCCSLPAGNAANARAAAPMHSTQNGKEQRAQDTPNGKGGGAGSHLLGGALMRGLPLLPQDLLTRGPWGAQPWRPCLRPRPRPWGPRIESRIGLPVGSLLLPLPLSRHLMNT